MVGAETARVKVSLTLHEQLAACPRPRGNGARLGQWSGPCTVSAFTPATGQVPRRCVPGPLPAVGYLIGEWVGSYLPRKSRVLEESVLDEAGRRAKVGSRVWLHRTQPPQTPGPGRVTRGVS